MSASKFSPFFVSYGKIYTALILFAVTIVLGSTASVHALDSKERAEGLRIAKLMSDAIADLAEEARPAVVTITSFAKQKPNMRQRSRRGQIDDLRRFFEDFGPFGFQFGDPFRQSPFNNPGEEDEDSKSSPSDSLVRRGIGSGFIIDKAGYIITNNHVIEDASVYTVRFADNREYTAKLIGGDPKSDIAVLQLEDPPANLPVLRLGDSDTLRAGNTVLAIGTPLRFAQTVTMGIVSATRRQVGMDTSRIRYEDFIQTDASINVGNSGGPLLNLDGEVIGINTMITSNSGGFEGISFAIPSNLIMKVWPQLRDKGEIVRGWLGMVMQDLPPEITEAMPEVKSGITFMKATPGSPAEKAGFQPGDIFMKYNGVSIENARHFQFMVADSAPGTTVNIELLRDGKIITAPVTLGSQPEEMNDTRTRPDSQRKSETKETYSDNVLGVTIAEVTVRGEKKVAITQISSGSPADLAGLKIGANIILINQQKITDIETFKKVVESLKGSRVVAIFFEFPDGTQAHVIARLK